MIESPNARYLTLLNPLDRSGFQRALSGLRVAGPGARYGDEKLRLALVTLQAAGVLHLSHINDEPIASWGVVLDRSRRPDGDTLEQYLKQLMALGEEGAGQRLGCIRPDGIIAQAQQASLCAWAEAGLLTDEVWRFDGHTVEYYGQAKIGKTKHGTKEKSVPCDSVQVDDDGTTTRLLTRQVLDLRKCTLLPCLRPMLWSHSTFWPLS